MILATTTDELTGWRFSLYRSNDGTPVHGYDRAIGTLVAGIQVADMPGYFVLLLDSPVSDLWGYCNQSTHFTEMSRERVEDIVTRLSRRDQRRWRRALRELPEFIQYVRQLNKGAGDVRL